MYYLVNWVSGEDAKGPDVPENAGFMHLAETRNDVGYALFHVDLPGGHRTAGMTPVPDELWEMLAAAESYAPAMALARNDMRRLQATSQTEFLEAMLTSLRSHLGVQRDRHFFLALSRQTEAGYRSAGSYYWIVGYRPDRPQREIDWVSRDFYIYSDALESFEIDIEYLNRLQLKP